LRGARLRIRGDRSHPGTQGYTCNKAMRLDHYQNGPHRLTTPLRRRPDGTHEEVDWDTAVAEIAAGFSRIRDEHGGSIFYYGGGGQGNHLGGAYSGAFLRAVGSRYRSNALAQEKTGEGWVEHSLYGGHTRGEFELAEVSVFVGKNPWMSQSFPRARVVLRDIAKDAERSMIVIDPVLTDTAKLADFHLRVRPGTDAWLPRRARRGARAGGPRRPRVSRRAHDRRGRRARACRRRRCPRLQPGVRRRGGAHPRRGAGPPSRTNEEFPIVLSVGERRSFTANDIFRDPSWRKRDADGALRLSVADAERLCLLDGDRARVVTERGSADAIIEVADSMLAGHASLPNGFGLIAPKRRRHRRRAELADLIALA
jgi:anaerobic selenocysteine-containing dehydrogenase